jgi:phosphoesterase RecJ-like protein
MLEICDADDDMVEGMVNYARRVEGAEIGALLWEWRVRGAGGNHLETKISLRSRGNADVSVIAAALNGGGHRAAAATQLNITIDEADELLRTELAKYLG